MALKYILYLVSKVERQEILLSILSCEKNILKKQGQTTYTLLYMENPQQKKPTQLLKA